MAKKLMIASIYLINNGLAGEESLNDCIINLPGNIDMHDQA